MEVVTDWIKGSPPRKIQTFSFPTRDMLLDLVNNELIGRLVNSFVNKGNAKVMAQVSRELDATNKSNNLLYVDGSFFIDENSRLL